MNQLPPGGKSKKLSHNEEKQKGYYAFAFHDNKRDFLILVVCIM